MYTIGREVSHTLQHAVRVQVEACSNLGGFFIFHSMAGGTGSGLSTLLLHELANEFAKYFKQELVIYPCPRVRYWFCDSHSFLELPRKKLKYNYVTSLENYERGVGEESMSVTEM